VRVEVEDDEGRGDDVTEAPGVQADVAQGLEHGVGQAIAAFTDRAEPVVGAVERLFQVGELAVGGFLERDDDGAGFGFVFAHTPARR